MKNLKNKKGFTLTELLIVVLIMGIVMAVAVPSYQALVGSATVKTCGDMQAVIINTFNEKYAALTKRIKAPRYASDGVTIVYKTDPKTHEKVPVEEYYDVSVVKPGTITIQTGPTGQYLDCSMGTTGIDKEEFLKLFPNKMVPCCSTPNNTIKIIITWSRVYSPTYKITSACYNIDGAETAHRLNDSSIVNK